MSTWEDYKDKYAWEGEGLDEVSAKELYLFINNDGDLYRLKHMPIIKNLVAKKARSVYQAGSAARLFGYLVESGAKKYCKEHCSRDCVWHDIFPKGLRDAVAQELRDDFEAEYALHNYDQLIPKKYQKVTKRRRSTGGRASGRRPSGLRALGR